MKKIDCHAHAFPWKGLEAMHKFYPDLISLHNVGNGLKYAVWANTPLNAWDAQSRIDKMDKAGIDMEVLQNPIIYNKLDENTAELCRIVNDSLAEASISFPDRFRFLASVPLNNIPDAVNEMKRAVCD